MYIKRVKLLLISFAVAICDALAVDFNTRQQTDALYTYTASSRKVQSTTNHYSPVFTSPNTIRLSGSRLSSHGNNSFTTSSMFMHSSTALGHFHSTAAPTTTYTGSSNIFTLRRAGEDEHPNDPYLQDLPVGDIPFILLALLALLYIKYRKPFTIKPTRQ